MPKSASLEMRVLLVVLLGAGLACVPWLATYLPTDLGDTDAPAIDSVLVGLFAVGGLATVLQTRWIGVLISSLLTFAAVYGRIRFGSAAGYVDWPPTLLALLGVLVAAALLSEVRARRSTVRAAREPD